jgi:hypothetical protein
LINRSISQLVNQSGNKTITQYWISQSADQSVYQTTSRSISSMCIGAAQILIPPSHQALNIGLYVKGCLALVAMLMIAHMIGGNLLFGLSDIFFIFWGLLIFRSNEGWSVQQIQCLVMISAILTALFTFDCIMFLAGRGVYDAPLWRWYFLVGGFIAAPIAYSLTCYFTWKLLREMKRVTNEFIREMTGEFGGEDSINQPIDFGRSDDIPQPLGFGGYFGRGYDQPIEPPSQSNNPYSVVPVAPEEPPVSQSSSQPFTPYSGQGHKLGDAV